MRAFGYARAFVCLSTLFPLSRLITGHQQRYICRIPCSFIHGALTSRRFSSAGRDFNMSGVSGDLLPAETNPTVFDSIVAGTIPCKKVYEDDLILAFHDINPVAPTHILVIPKKRDSLSRLSRATEDHAHILGHMMVKIVRENNIGDFRLVVNNGPQSGQEVYHLHMHIIGGRKLSWPPG
ncbi:HIT domain containing protein [Babesia divergens]|uniref:HIT domain containing protein n=1 Tax=Babesia divergens TaxID=32595 RepID=A0AAD9GFD8_BABDI|nr:HIT domain containing protein [Babesia divergens]